MKRIGKADIRLHRCIYYFLNVTLIISDSEVWIDVLLGDHREVEVVSVHGLVWINSTEQLNELSDTKTHYKGNMSNTSPKLQSSWEV